MGRDSLVYMLCSVRTTDIANYYSVLRNRRAQYVQVIDSHSTAKKKKRGQQIIKANGMNEFSMVIDMALPRPNRPVRSVELFKGLFTSSSMTELSFSLSSKSGIIFLRSSVFYLSCAILPFPSINVPLISS